MKKNFMALVAASAILSTSSAAFADEKDDRIKELETQVEDMQSTIDDLQALVDELKEQLEKYTAGSDKDVYEIGDTWTVAGQWELTIDSVEEINERNEYADTDPAAVYMVTYSYENLGYEDKDGLLNGLYIDLSMAGIVDADKKMGYAYPGDITMYPQEAPIDAKCEAQACVGVDNAGNFKLNVSAYDSDGNEQKATFSVVVEPDEESSTEN